MAFDTSTRLVDVAEARSAAYGLIARALHDPDDALVGELSHPDRWRDWPSVIQDTDADVGHCLMELKNIIATFDKEQELLCESHLRLFGHTVRAAVPPYELEYGQGEIYRQAAELADISGFYSAFGMEIVAGEHERADHICIECEFMSALAAKEAYALTTKKQDAYEIVRDAERNFLQDHLGCWLPSFARRIQDHAPEGFYGLVARFARAFVAVDCHHFKIEIGQPLLALRPADPVADANIDCGMEQRVPGAQSDSLVQIGIDPSLDGSIEGEDVENRV